MTTISKYAPGQFSWVDLMSPDAAASSRFYTQLFGWTAVDNEDPQGGVYTQFYQGDAVIAGLGEMSPEMKASGMPAIWNSYVTVQDLDASLERATGLGGRVEMPAMQIMDVGRMAILADPTAARFSLWQAGTHIGAGLVNEPVSLTWNELATGDVDAAAAFYADLFGWTISDPSGDGSYWLIENDGRMNGGIRPFAEDEQGVPPNWMTILAVADCDAAGARGAELGGQVIVPGQDIPQGRFSVIADPHGGVFTVMRVDDPD